MVLLWNVFHSGAFVFPRVQGPLPHHGALNGLFKAFFCWRRTMNDLDYMRMALELAERGRG